MRPGACLQRVLAPISVQFMYVTLFSDSSGCAYCSVVLLTLMYICMFKNSDISMLKRFPTTVQLKIDTGLYAYNCSLQNTYYVLGKDKTITHTGLEGSTSKTELQCIRAEILTTAPCKSH